MPELSTPASQPPPAAIARAALEKDYEEVGAESAEGEGPRARRRARSTRCSPLRVPSDAVNPDGVAGRTMRFVLAVKR